jgi:nucleoside-diphosphate-sugar epimerase
MRRVLVTGGSGYLGTHVLLQLLAAGHDVRTTVRAARRADAVREMLRRGGAADPERVAFATADLTADDGWADAVAGRDVVLHVASPFPPGAPRHEDELIVPARDGTRRVLEAAAAAGVRRVVLTSSFAAIGYTRPPDPARPFTEEDWTDPAGDVSAYVKSKTLAERAAWEVAAAHPAMELTVVNPTAIFGPVLGPDYASSVELVKAMLDRRMPALARLSFGVVDVRDVADLHLRAMDAPQAAGERYLAVAEDAVSLRRIAAILRAELGGDARRVPTRELPDWVVRAGARVVPALRQAVPQLGVVKRISSTKAREALGWSPRPIEETIAETGRSLIALAR